MITAATPCGSSQNGLWPRLSKIFTRAPGSASRSACFPAASINGSSLPQMRSAGAFARAPCGRPIGTEIGSASFQAIRTLHRLQCPPAVDPRRRLAPCRAADAANRKHGCGRCSSTMPSPRRAPDQSELPSATPACIHHRSLLQRQQDYGRWLSRGRAPWLPSSHKAPLARPYHPRRWRQRHRQTLAPVSQWRPTNPPWGLRNRLPHLPLRPSSCSAAHRARLAAAKRPTNSIQASTATGPTNC